MVSVADRVAYAGSQTARVGWFIAEYFLALRALGNQVEQDYGRRARTTADGLSWLSRELYQLFRRDWDNIAAGFYKPPHDMSRPPQRLLATARAYFDDLPRVNRRRLARGNSEVYRAPPPGTPKLPRYYLQNFHYQTDGYLSERSARLYDHQVEILFGGGADAMRRRLLVPIHFYLRRRRAAEVRLIDVASGTGQFLTFLKDNHPAMDVTALDLSAPYLAEARRRLERYGRIRYAVGGAEAIPLPDASVDLVTCIFLFHELPRRVRAAAATEMARVLKPGGQVLFLDSIQRGDRDNLDKLLDAFPQQYHEPYYDDYTRQDLPALFEDAGLRLGGSDIVFMSKMMVLEKP